MTLQSELFAKTLKESPSDEVALNAQLLSRASFVNKVLSGVYTYLPLGIRVLSKIEQIVREEMTRIGGQEILMPALHPKEYWLQTGRWDTFEALFKLSSKYGSELALGSTHEEIVVPLAQHVISSYQDLPISVFQIQSKFRDEPRAKSGLLRGREFRMKDMYSFHRDTPDLDRYYERVLVAYQRIFDRLHLQTFLTEASGGTFSKLSHEFQVVTDAGEDVIAYCKQCQKAINTEITDSDVCPTCHVTRDRLRACEVANTFKLYTKYSDPFDLVYTDSTGKRERVVMGCYGIGTSRIMGTLVEIFHDSDGIIWPRSVSPYAVHLILLPSKNPVFYDAARSFAHECSEKLEKVGYEVLLDDREGVSAGQKLKESDLIGICDRMIVSERTLKERQVEYSTRLAPRESRNLSIDEVIRTLQNI